VKPTVFRRNVNTNYALKMKSSRAIFAEICRRFSVFPFSLRSLEEGSHASSARLGIVECHKHQLIEPFIVLYEKSGEYVAQFKFTALILSTDTIKLTDYELPYIHSDKSLTDPNLIELLKVPVKSSKSIKKKHVSSNVNNPLLIIDFIIIHNSLPILIFNIYVFLCHVFPVDDIFRQSDGPIKLN
jgi:hypothetical protein